MRSKKVAARTAERETKPSDAVRADPRAYPVSDIALIVGVLRARWAWRHFPKHYRARPRSRVHPRVRAREVERVEGLMIDRAGRILCGECGGPGGPTHRCNFMEGWNV